MRAGPCGACAHSTSIHRIPQPASLKKNEVCPAGCHRPGAEPWPKPGWQRRLSLTCLPRRVRELLRTSRTSPLPPAARWTEPRLALTSFLLHCIRSRAPRERRDHWLRLHRGLASSTPSFCRHTDCARCRLNDNRGLPSRNPRLSFKRQDSLLTKRAGLCEHSTPLRP